HEIANESLAERKSAIGQDTQLRLEVSDIKVCDTAKNDFSVSEYLIKSNLINTSSETVCFVVMSCSFTDNFKSSNHNLLVVPNFNCHSNFPTRICLEPGESFENEILISSLSKHEMPLLTKIGFKFIEFKTDNHQKPEPPEEYSRYLWIWSTPLNIHS